MSGERRVEQARVERAADAVASVQAMVEAEAAVSASRPAQEPAETAAAPIAVREAPARDVLSITGSRLE